MRKLLLSGGLATLLILMIVGCLKDEEFEDQQYGLQVPEVNGVSFPQQLQSPVTIGIVSQATSQEVTGPLLALNSKGPSSSPVTVNLATDDALVTADPDLTLMPAGSYTVNSLNVAIPAGEITSDAVKITIPDATVLDPSKKYGIGFKITSADQGYVVAKNLSSVVIAFTIKNKYDGKYNLNMTSVGWGAYSIADGENCDYPPDFDLITDGPTSLTIFNNSRGDNLQPGFTPGCGPTAFGAASPKYTFDANDKLVSVVNIIPDDGRGRAFQVAPLAGSNYFDPATKTIYMNYIMKQNGRPDQTLTLTWTYIGPR